MVNYIRPASVLDVGVGFGKYGMLLREYLKFWSPLEDLNVRTGRIDGIEIFESYITAGQRYYYDSIYIGNALDIIPKLKNYDLILMIDVLEHLNRDDGHKLLTLCQKRAEYVIISTPIKMNVQGPAYGNDFEMHRAQWHSRDFEKLPNSARRLNYKSLIYLVGIDSEKIMSKIRLENFKVYINYQVPWLVDFLSHIKKIFMVDNTKR